MQGVVVLLYVMGTMLPFMGLHLVGGICFCVGIMLHFMYMPIPSNWGFGSQPANNYYSDEKHIHYHHHEAQKFATVSRAEEVRVGDKTARRLTQWHGNKW